MARTDWPRRICHHPAGVPDAHRGLWRAVLLTRRQCRWSERALILKPASNGRGRVNWVKGHAWTKSPVFPAAARIRTAAGFLAIAPASKKGEDSYEAWFGLAQSTFGGF